MTKGGFKVVAVRGGSRCRRPAVHCASANHCDRDAGRCRSAVRWRGCGDDSNGDVIALAATKAGGEQRDESGGGEGEEAMMVAVAMLPCKGRQWGNRDDDDGEEEVVEVRWTTTMRPSRCREVAAGKRAGVCVMLEYRKEQAV